MISRTASIWEPSFCVPATFSDIVRTFCLLDGIVLDSNFAVSEVVFDR